MIDTEYIQRVNGQLLVKQEQIDWLRAENKRLRKLLALYEKSDAIQKYLIASLKGELAHKE